MIKVCRHANLFERELAVYQRLSLLGLHQLQGFRIPSLLDQDAEQWFLELSLISPPFILDFAAASLGKQPAEMESTEWIGEKQRLFGPDWSEVQRRLDGLRLYGIHFPDMHLGNIRHRK